MTELSRLSASCGESLLSKGTISNLTGPAQPSSLARRAVYWKLLSTFSPRPAMGPDIWSIEAILTVCAWAEVSASRPQAAASHGQRAILKFVVILSPV